MVLQPLYNHTLTAKGPTFANLSGQMSEGLEKGQLEFGGCFGATAAQELGVSRFGSNGGTFPRDA